MPDELSPKALEKRTRILSVSTSIFAKDGFGGTDVQEIADGASVGKGTVYRHFGSKQELFLATARHCLEQLSAFVRESVGNQDALPSLVARDGVVEVLRQIAIACARFYEEQPQAVEIMIQERAEFRNSVPSHLLYRAETRAGLDQLIRQAIVESDVDVVSATNAYADLIYGSVVNGCLEGNQTSLVVRMERAIDIFLRGLTGLSPQS